MPTPLATYIFSTFCFIAAYIHVYYSYVIPAQVQGLKLCKGRLGGPEKVSPGRGVDQESCHVRGDTPHFSDATQQPSTTKDNHTCQHTIITLMYFEEGEK